MKKIDIESFDDITVVGFDIHAKQKNGQIKVYKSGLSDIAQGKISISVKSRKATLHEIFKEKKINLKKLDSVFLSNLVTQKFGDKTNSEIAKVEMKENEELKKQKNIINMQLEEMKHKHDQLKLERRRIEKEHEELKEKLKKKQDLEDSDNIEVSKIMPVIFQKKGGKDSDVDGANEEDAKKKPINQNTSTESEDHVSQSGRSDITPVVEIPLLFELADISDSNIKGDFITNVANNIQFFGKTLKKYKVDLIINGNQLMTKSSSDGSFSFKVPGALSDKEYNVQVNASGPDGKASISKKLLIDTKPPSIPSGGLAKESDKGESNTDGITNDNQPKFEGKAEPRSTVLLSIDGKKNEIVAGQDGSWAISLSSKLEDGTKLYKITAMDVAGNISPALEAGIVIDTQLFLEGGMIEDKTNDTGKSQKDGITSQDKPKFKGTVDKDAKLKFSLSGKPNVKVDIAVAESGIWEFNSNSEGYDNIFSGIKEGAYHYKIEATDVAGNIKQIDKPYVYDVTKPIDDGFSLDKESDSGRSNTDSITNQQGDLFISGKTEKEIAVTVEIEDKKITDNSGVTVDWKVNVGAFKDEKLYKYNVLLEDLAGNQTKKDGEFIIDRTPPIPATGELKHIKEVDTGRSTQDSITKVVKPTFSGTKGKGSSVKINIDSKVFDVLTSNKYQSNKWEHQITEELQQGAYKYSFIAEDAAGNQITTKNKTSLIIDTETAKPTSKLMKQSDSGINSDQITSILVLNPKNISFQGTVEKNSDIVFSSKNSVIQKSLSNDQRDWRVTIFNIKKDDYPTGMHEYSVKVTDVAGNVNSDSFKFETDNDAPIITNYYFHSEKIEHFKPSTINIRTNHSKPNFYFSLDEKHATQFTFEITSANKIKKTIAGVLANASSIEGSNIFKAAELKISDTKLYTGLSITYKIVLKDIVDNSSHFQGSFVYDDKTFVTGSLATQFDSIGETVKGVQYGTSSDGLTNIHKSLLFEGTTEKVNAKKVTLWFDQNPFKDSVVNIGVNAKNAYSATINKSQGSWQVVTSNEFKEGKYTYQIKAEDDVGNIAILKNKLDVDLTAPEIKIKLNSKFQHKVKGKFYFAFKTLDEISGISEGKTVISFFKGQELERQYTNDGGWVFKIPQKQIVENILNIFQVKSTDQAGNIKTKDVKFYIDTETSISRINLAPKSDSAVKGDKLTNTKDLYIEGVGEPRAKVLVKYGSADFKDFGIVDESEKWSADLSRVYPNFKKDGIETDIDLIFKSVDELYNESKPVSYNFKIDRVKPKVNIDTKDKLRIKDTKITITGIVNEKSNIKGFIKDDNNQWVEKDSLLVDVDSTKVSKSVTPLPKQGGNAGAGNKTTTEENIAWKLDFDLHGIVPMKAVGKKIEYKIVAVDMADNQSKGVVQSFIVDKYTALTAEIEHETIASYLKKPGAPFIKDENPNFKGTVEKDAKIHISINKQDGSSVYNKEVNYKVKDPADPNAVTWSFRADGINGLLKNNTKYKYSITVKDELDNKTDKKGNVIEITNEFTTDFINELDKQAIKIKVETDSGRQGPNAKDTSTQNDQITNNVRPIISGIGEVGSHIKVLYGITSSNQPKTDYGEIFVQNSSNNSANINTWEVKLFHEKSDLIHAEYEYIIESYDKANNKATVAKKFTIDIKKPPVPIFEINASLYQDSKKDFYVIDKNVVFSGLIQDDIKVELSYLKPKDYKKQVIIPAYSDLKTPTWSITISNDQQSEVFGSERKFQITYQDRAGNISLKEGKYILDTYTEITGSIDSTSRKGVAKKYINTEIPRFFGNGEKESLVTVDFNLKSTTNTQKLITKIQQNNSWEASGQSKLKNGQLYEYKITVEDHAKNSKDISGNAIELSGMFELDTVLPILGTKKLIYATNSGYAFTSVKPNKNTAIDKKFDLSTSDIYTKNTQPSIFISTEDNTLVTYELHQANQKLQLKQEKVIFLSNDSRTHEIKLELNQKNLHLLEGQYLVKFSMTDKASNIQKDSFDFFIDTTPPVLNTLVINKKNALEKVSGKYKPLYTNDAMGEVSFSGTTENDSLLVVTLKKDTGEKNNIEKVLFSDIKSGIWKMGNIDELQKVVDCDGFTREYEIKISDKVGNQAQLFQGKYILDLYTELKGSIVKSTRADIANTSNINLVNQIPFNFQGDSEEKAEVQVEILSNKGVALVPPVIERNNQIGQNKKWSVSIQNATIQPNIKYKYKVTVKDKADNTKGEKQTNIDIIEDFLYDNENKIEDSSVSINPSSNSLLPDLSNLTGDVFFYNDKKSKFETYDQSKDQKRLDTKKDNITSTTQPTIDINAEQGSNIKVTLLQENNGNFSKSITMKSNEKKIGVCDYDAHSMTSQGHFILNNQGADLTHGKYQYKIESIDCASNSKTLTPLEILIDTKKPATPNQVKLNSSLLDNNVVSINTISAVFEGNSEIKDRVVLTNRNAGTLKESHYIYDLKQPSWSIGFDLQTPKTQDGIEYGLEIAYYDVAGNSSQKYSARYFVDTYTEINNLTIDGQSTKVLTKQPSLQLKGAFELEAQVDLFYVSVPTPSLNKKTAADLSNFCENNDTAASVKQLLTSSVQGSTTKNININTPTSDGDYYACIVATDKATNKAYKAIEIVKDTMPPTLDIEGLTDSTNSNLKSDQITNINQVMIHGRSEPKAKITIESIDSSGTVVNKFNKQEIKSQNNMKGNWQFAIDLSTATDYVQQVEGFKYYYQATAEDTATNKITKKQSFIIDQYNHVLTVDLDPNSDTGKLHNDKITSPLLLKTNNKDFKISGTADANTKISLVYNNRNAVTTSTDLKKTWDFIADINVLKNINKKIDFEVTSKDLAGNEAHQVLSVTLDNTIDPIVFTINDEAYKAKSHYVNNADISFKGNAQEQIEAKLEYIDLPSKQKFPSANIATNNSDSTNSNEWILTVTGDAQATVDGTERKFKITHADIAGNEIEKKGQYIIDTYTELTGNVKNNNRDPGETNNYINTSIATFEGTGENDAEVQLSIYSSTDISKSHAVENLKTIIKKKKWGIDTKSSWVDDSEYTYTIEIMDHAENEGDNKGAKIKKSGSFYVDLTQPVINSEKLSDSSNSKILNYSGSDSAVKKLIQDSTQDNITNNKKPSIEGITEDNTEVSIELLNQGTKQTYHPASPKITFLTSKNKVWNIQADNVGADLASGNYQATINFIDKASNQNQGFFNFEIDHTSPLLTSLSINQNDALQTNASGYKEVITNNIGEIIIQGVTEKNSWITVSFFVDVNKKNPPEYTHDLVSAIDGSWKTQINEDNKLTSAEGYTRYYQVKVVDIANNKINKEFESYYVLDRYTELTGRIDETSRIKGGAKKFINSLTPTFSGTSEDKAKVSIEVLDALQASLNPPFIINNILVASDGSWKTTANNAKHLLKETKYQYKIEVEDKVGNDSNEQGIKFAIIDEFFVDTETRLDESKIKIKDSDNTFIPSDTTDQAALKTVAEATKQDTITSMRQPHIEFYVESGSTVLLDLKEITGATKTDVTIGSNLFISQGLCDFSAYSKFETGSLQLKHGSGDLDEGNYEYTITVNDCADNRKISGVKGLIIDSTMPVKPDNIIIENRIYGSVSTFYINTKTFEFAGKSIEHDRVVLTTDAKDYKHDISSSKGDWNIGITINNSVQDANQDGREVNFKIFYYDQAGNKSDDYIGSYTLDLVTKIENFQIEGKAKHLTKENLVQLSGLAEKNASLDIQLVPVAQFTDCKQVKAHNYHKLLTVQPEAGKTSGESHAWDNAYDITTLADEKYKLCIRSTDVADNTAYAFVDLEVDRTPPILRVKGLSQGTNSGDKTDELTNIEQIKIVGTSEADATIKVTITNTGSNIKTNTIVQKNNQWETNTIDLSGETGHKNLILGKPYTYEVVATDAAGNEKKVTGKSFTLDTKLFETTGVISSISDTGKSNTDQKTSTKVLRKDMKLTNFSFEGTAEHHSTIILNVFGNKYNYNKGKTLDCKTLSKCLWTMGQDVKIVDYAQTYSDKQSPELKDYQIKTTDLAGNTDTKDFSFTIRDILPTISDFSFQGNVGGHFITTDAPTFLFKSNEDVWNFDIKIESTTPAVTIQKTKETNFPKSTAEHQVVGLLNSNKLQVDNHSIYSPVQYDYIINVTNNVGYKSNDFKGTIYYDQGTFITIRLVAASDTYAQNAPKKYGDDKDTITNNNKKLEFEGETENVTMSNQSMLINIMFQNHIVSISSIINGKFTFTLSSNAALTDAEYSYSFNAEDPAKNKAYTQDKEQKFTVDTLQPELKTVKLLNTQTNKSGGPERVTGRQLVFTGEASEDCMVFVDVNDGSNSLGIDSSEVNKGNFSITYLKIPASVQATTTYTYKVYAYDKAGNKTKLEDTGKFQVSVDAKINSIDFKSGYDTGVSQKDLITNSEDLFVQITTQSNAEVFLSDDGTLTSLIPSGGTVQNRQQGTFQASKNGIAEYNIINKYPIYGSQFTKASQEVTLYFQVQILKKSSNSLSSSSIKPFTFILDRTAPTLAITDPTKAKITNNGTYTITGTGGEDAKITIKAGQVTNTPTYTTYKTIPIKDKTSSTDRNWSYDLTLGQQYITSEEGQKLKVLVEAEDLAGNQHTANATITFDTYTVMSGVKINGISVDNYQPTDTVYLATGNIDITGESERGATVTAKITKLGSTSPSTKSVVVGTSKAWELKGFTVLTKDQLYSYEVTVLDKASNTKDVYSAEIKQQAQITYIDSLNLKAKSIKLTSATDTGYSYPGNDSTHTDQKTSTKSPIIEGDGLPQHQIYLYVVKNTNVGSIKVGGTISVTDLEKYQSYQHKEVIDLGNRSQWESQLPALSNVGYTYYVYAKNLANSDTAIVTKTFEVNDAKPVLTDIKINSTPIASFSKTTNKEITITGKANLEGRAYLYIKDEAGIDYDFIKKDDKAANTEWTLEYDKNTQLGRQKRSNSEKPINIEYKVFFESEVGVSSNIINQSYQYDGYTTLSLDALSAQVDTQNNLMKYYLSKGAFDFHGLGEEGATVTLNLFESSGSALSALCTTGNANKVVVPVSKHWSISSCNAIQENTTYKYEITVEDAFGNNADQQGNIIKLEGLLIQEPDINLYSTDLKLDLASDTGFDGTHDTTDTTGAQTSRTAETIIDTVTNLDQPTITGKYDAGVSGKLYITNNHNAQIAEIDIGTNNKNTASTWSRSINSSLSNGLYRYYIEYCWKGICKTLDKTSHSFTIDTDLPIVDEIILNNHALHDGETVKINSNAISLSASIENGARGLFVVHGSYYQEDKPKNTGWAKTFQDNIDCSDPNSSNAKCGAVDHYYGKEVDIRFTVIDAAGNESAPLIVKYAIDKHTYIKDIKFKTTTPQVKDKLQISGKAEAAAEIHAYAIKVVAAGDTPICDISKDGNYFPQTNAKVGTVDPHGAFAINQPISVIEGGIYKTCLRIKDELGNKAYALTDHYIVQVAATNITLKNLSSNSRSSSSDVITNKDVITLEGAISPANAEVSIEFVNTKYQLANTSIAKQKIQTDNGSWQFDLSKIQSVLSKISTKENIVYTIIAKTDGLAEYKAIGKFIIDKEVIFDINMGLSIYTVSDQPLIYYSNSLDLEFRGTKEPSLSTEIKYKMIDSYDSSEDLKRNYTDASSEHTITNTINASNKLENWKVDHVAAATFQDGNNYIFKFESTDLAGNVKTNYRMVKVDTFKPVITGVTFDRSSQVNYHQKSTTYYETHLAQPKFFLGLNEKAKIKFDSFSQQNQKSGGVSNKNLDIKKYYSSVDQATFADKIEINLSPSESLDSGIYTYKFIATDYANNDSDEYVLKLKINAESLKITGFYLDVNSNTGEITDQITKTKKPTFRLSTNYPDVDMSIESPDGTKVNQHFLDASGNSATTCALNMCEIALDDDQSEGDITYFAHAKSKTKQDAVPQSLTITYDFSCADINITKFPNQKITTSQSLFIRGNLNESITVNFSGYKQDSSGNITANNPSFSEKISRSVGAGTWTLEYTSQKIQALASGKYSYKVEAYDIAGNVCLVKYNGKTLSLTETKDPEFLILSNEDMNLQVIGVKDGINGKQLLNKKSVKIQGTKASSPEITITAYVSCNNLTYTYQAAQNTSTWEMDFPFTNGFFSKIGDYGISCSYSVTGTDVLGISTAAINKQFTIDYKTSIVLGKNDIPFPTSNIEKSLYFPTQNVNNHALLKDITLSNNFTIESWFNIDGSISLSDIYYFSLESSASKLALKNNNNIVQLYDLKTSTEVATNTVSVSANKWFHLALTYDKNAKKFTVYKDGSQLFDTTSYGLNQSALFTLLVGNYQGNSQTSSVFQGQIQGLRVWQSVRTVDQIKDNKHDATIQDSDLIGKYDFNGAGVNLSTNNKLNGSFENSGHIFYLDKFNDIYTKEDTVDIPYKAETSANVVCKYKSIADRTVAVSSYNDSCASMANNNMLHFAKKSGDGNTVVYSIQLEATDTAENKASAIKVVTFDKEPPTITVSLQNCSSGTTCNFSSFIDQDFAISVTNTDTTSSYVLVDITSTDSAKPYSYATQFIYTNQWSSSETLNDGTYLINFVALDRAGNKSTPSTFNFGILKSNGIFSDVSLVSTDQVNSQPLVTSSTWPSFKGKGDITIKEMTFKVQVNGVYEDRFSMSSLNSNSWSKKFDQPLTIDASKADKDGKSSFNFKVEGKSNYDTDFAKFSGVFYVDTACTNVRLVDVKQDTNVIDITNLGQSKILDLDKNLVISGSYDEDIDFKLALVNKSDASVKSSDFPAAVDSGQKTWTVTLSSADLKGISNGSYQIKFDVHDLAQNVCTVQDSTNKEYLIDNQTFVLSVSGIESSKAYKSDRTKTNQKVFTIEGQISSRGNIDNIKSKDSIISQASKSIHYDNSSPNKNWSFSVDLSSESLSYEGKTYSYEIEATDKKNNSKHTATGSFLIDYSTIVEFIDSHKPEKSSLAKSANKFYTNLQDFKVLAKAEKDATVKIKFFNASSVNGDCKDITVTSAEAMTKIENSGQYDYLSYALSSKLQSLKNGEIRAVIVATDSMGNVKNDCRTFSVVDSTVTRELKVKDIKIYNNIGFVISTEPKFEVTGGSSLKETELKLKTYSDTMYATLSGDQQCSSCTPSNTETNTKTGNFDDISVWKTLTENNYYQISAKTKDQSDTRVQINTVGFIVDSQVDYEDMMLSDGYDDDPNVTGGKFKTNKVQPIFKITAEPWTQQVTLSIAEDDGSSLFSDYGVFIKKDAQNIFEATANKDLVLGNGIQSKTFKYKFKIKNYSGTEKETAEKTFKLMSSTCVYDINDIKIHIDNWIPEQKISDISVNTILITTLKDLKIKLSGVTNYSSEIKLEATNNPSSGTHKIELTSGGVGYSLANSVGTYTIAKSDLTSLHDGDYKLTVSITDQYQNSCTISNDKVYTSKLFKLVKSSSIASNGIISTDRVSPNKNLSTKDQFFITGSAFLYKTVDFYLQRLDYQIIEKECVTNENVAEDGTWKIKIPGTNCAFNKYQVNTFNTAGVDVVYMIKGEPIDSSITNTDSVDFNLKVDHKVFTQTDFLGAMTLNSFDIEGIISSDVKSISYVIKKTDETAPTAEADYNQQLVLKDCVLPNDELCLNLVMYQKGKMFDTLSTLHSDEENGKIVFKANLFNQKLSIQAKVEVMSCPNNVKTCFKTYIEDKSHFSTGWSSLTKETDGLYKTTAIDKSDCANNNYQVVLFKIDLLNNKELNAAKITKCATDKYAIHELKKTDIEYVETQSNKYVNIHGKISKETDATFEGIASSVYVAKTEVDPDIITSSEVDQDGGWLLEYEKLNPDQALQLCYNDVFANPHCKDLEDYAFTL